MRTGTAGRCRFSSAVISAASEPSWFRSRTTTSTVSLPNRVIPSCPLPELNTRQPCSWRSAQRRFRFTKSFPMQRTALLPIFLTGPPPLPEPGVRPECRMQDTVTTWYTRRAVTAITGLPQALFPPGPRRSARLRTAHSSRFLPAGKSPIRRARIYPHAGSAYGRGLLAQGMPLV